MLLENVDLLLRADAGLSAAGKAVMLKRSRPKGLGIGSEDERRSRMQIPILALCGGE